MDMDDDDFFDEELLRRVDQVEREYIDELARKREADKPPPAKRPRLNTPEKPLTRQTSIHANYIPPNDDDNPEIVLDDQGNYSFSSSWQPPQKTGPTSVTRSLKRDAPTSYGRSGLPNNKTTNAQQSTHLSSFPPGLPARTLSPKLTHAGPPQDSTRGIILERQISDMQVQLTKLQQSNEVLSASLQEAQEAKWTREGEVANLRRIIDQRNTHHATEINKLKEERQKADAARAESEKVMKEDMERMKTRLLIRQQELETSTRKRASLSRRLPGSSQVQLISQTPVPSHSRGTQGWNPQDTPAVNRRRDDKRHVQPPTPMFDGFVNSFQSSSPVRSPTKNRKLKNTVLPAESHGERSSSPIAPSFNNVWTSTKQTTETPRGDDQCFDDSNWPSSPATGLKVNLEQPADDQEEPDFRFGIPAIDLDEVHTVIMHHRRNSSASLLSIQVLLAANSSREYCQACSMLVQRGRIGNAIVDMADILSKSDPFPRDAVATLLDLTAYLLYSYPPLTDAVLAIRNSDSTESLPKILNVILSLARSITEDVVIFLEAISWNLMDQHMDVVSELLQQPGFTDLILDKGNIAGVRVLAVLASYPTLYQALLHRPRDGQKGLIDRLGGIIVDNVDGEMQVAALTCIGQLALAHDDARTALLDSPALIPVLVQRVWTLVGEIWDREADESSIFIRVLQHAVHIMHHLALSRGATNELRDRLHNGSGGLDYMFAVAIGRLAYADPPARLSLAICDELRKLTEFSRDLLELVVDGPEMDDIYSAYQWDEAKPTGDLGGTASISNTEDSLMDDDFVVY